MDGPLRITECPSPARGIFVQELLQIWNDTAVMFPELKREHDIAVEWLEKTWTIEELHESVEPCGEQQRAVRILAAVHAERGITIHWEPRCYDATVEAVRRAYAAGRGDPSPHARIAAALERIADGLEADRKVFNKMVEKGHNLSA